MGAEEWAARFAARLAGRQEVSAENPARSNQGGRVIPGFTPEEMMELDPNTGRYPGDHGPQQGATNAEIRFVLLLLSACEWRPAPLVVEMGEVAVLRALAIAQTRGWIYAYGSKRRGHIVYRLTAREKE